VEKEERPFPGPAVAIGLFFRRIFLKKSQPSFIIFKKPVDNVKIPAKAGVFSLIYCIFLKNN
jgi:hypothetical protein